MHQNEWLQMLTFQQELHCLSRTLLSQSPKQTLTASERELLSRLYLEPTGSTPLSLSRSSGMKKEAVSRCLKHLVEKEFIQKEKHPQDDRSFILSITEAGRAELRQNYGVLLQPLYDLQRQMGPDFDALFQLIHQANAQNITR